MQPATTINYREVYDRLYDAGYHDDWKDRTHADKTLWPWCLKELEFASMLDVGASYGALVARATEAGKQAVGLEISEQACRWAQEHGRDVRQGSMLSMPFPDRSFDLVLSSDTFEHLAKADLNRAVFEAIRVSRRYVAMKIAVRMDVMKKWKRLVGHDLHLSMLPHETWVALFGFAASVHDRAPAKVKDWGRGMFVMELKA